MMPDVEYPLIFDVQGPSGKSTHTGVYEFTAEEGQCYMPYWVIFIAGFLTVLMRLLGDVEYWCR